MPRELNSIGPSPKTSPKCLMNTQRLEKNGWQPTEASRRESDYLPFPPRLIKETPFALSRTGFAELAPRLLASLGASRARCA